MFAKAYWAENDGRSGEALRTISLDDLLPKTKKGEANSASPS